MSLPESASYVGLFLLIFLGEAGVPLFVPVELALIAAGVAFAHDIDVLIAVAAVALSADVLGTLCLFGLVRAAMSGRHVPRFWRRIMSSATRLARRIGGHDARWVAAGRAVPFVRVPTAGAAALAGLPAQTYGSCALAGGIVWTVVFLGGAAASVRWPL